jgi:hypothetical protein
VPVCIRNSLDSSMNKVHHGFWHFGIDQGKENVLYWLFLFKNSFINTVDTPLNYSCFGRKLFMRSCWMLQTTGFHICKQKTIDNCTWNLSLKFIEADLLWRSFYLRRSSIGSFVERDFFIRILLKVYFDFASSK